MSKLRFVTISSTDIVVRTKKDNTVGSVTLTENGKWAFVPYSGDEISRKHMVEIAEYMLRLANLPKAEPADTPVTLAYDVKHPGTVTQYATAASSRMVMPGTASIRFVIENRDYTLNITGVIVGENASVEVRQENEAWSL